MDKVICDICGKEMDVLPFVKPITDYMFHISELGRTWNVCEKCKAEFCDWVKMRRGEQE